MEQDQFIPGEPIVIEVRITNVSGAPLRFGVDRDWISIEVKGLRGETVTRIAEVSAPGAVVIQNAETQSRKIDITPFFDLTRTGQYRVVAHVKVRETGEFEMSAKDKRFEILKGTRVWEQAFGVQGGSDPALPDARKFALIRSSNPKKMRLYLRLTDIDEKNIFKVLTLGQALTFNQVEAKLDRMGLLHVLHQTGSKSFTYHVISPDADLVMRHTYDYEGTRPMLKGDGEGRVAVTGGLRKPSASDLPEPKPPSP